MKLFKRTRRVTKEEFIKEITEWTVYGFSRDITQYFHLDLYPDMKQLFDMMSKEQQSGATGELVVLHIFGMLENLFLHAVQFDVQEEFRKRTMGMAAQDLPAGIDAIKVMELRFAEYRKIWAEDPTSGKLGIKVAENIFGKELLDTAPAAKLLAERSVMKSFCEYMKETSKLLDGINTKDLK